MRGGNFFYQLYLPEAFIVHRGVSQSGKKLTAGQRKSFWRKNNRDVAGIKIGDGKVIVSLNGLQVLREKNLVIVSSPGKPKVWTIKRIKELNRLTIL